MNNSKPGDSVVTGLGVDLGTVAVLQLRKPSSGKVNRVPVKQKQPAQPSVTIVGLGFGAGIPCTDGVGVSGAGVGGRVGVCVGAGLVGPGVGAGVRCTDGVGVGGAGVGDRVGASVGSALVGPGVGAGVGGTDGAGVGGAGVGAMLGDGVTTSVE